MYVGQMGPATTSCYVQPQTPMPEGIDYAETTLTEVAEEADADTAAAIQSLVPECQGRTIYALEEATEDPSTGRKMRECGWKTYCRLRYLEGLGWYTYCGLS